MVKDTETVIQEFTELVNMDPDELEEWLGTEASLSTGWPKSDGSGESIGHESGRKIVQILRHNPEKDPEAFEEHEIQHMRKVVSYCKRHLAREENSKRNPESRSYRSLKNWGHDALKE
ncbi:hypothetical protein B0T20DRAFT_422883 [Sordaria brevicollis]|uniref:DNA-binding protein n=1 Tax=Sordaria brevicollis TaxID=83679 RepID=A0AAE0P2B8_SORBR|nr:hypothetical protein B0T20DRAFT_422883 [Sordaria brevicollis]